MDFKIIIIHTSLPLNQNPGPVPICNILDYTSVNYRFVYSYEEEYVQNMKSQPHNKKLSRPNSCVKKRKRFEA